MKADKNFKLDKSVKRVLSSILDPVARNAYKKAMISAQLDYEAAKKKTFNFRF